MLTIRRAAAADQPQLMAIYRTAQEYMLQTGNPTQWGRSYPSPELIRSDIAQGICRVLSDEAGIHGVFALLDTPEPTYSRIEGAWRNDAPYLTIHRLAGDGRTHGLFRCAADYCKAISRNVRADTHAAFAGGERLPPLRHDPCAGRNAPAGIPLDGRPPVTCTPSTALRPQHSPIQHAKRPGA